MGTEIRRHLRIISSTQRRVAEDGEHMISERDSDKDCAICKTPLTVQGYYEYRGNPMDRIIGPGGDNQMTKVVQTFCKKCGLLYVYGGGVPREVKKDE